MNAPNSLAWIYLLIAAIFEIGWPLGLKIAQSPERRWSGLGLSTLSFIASGVFLYLAQRSIPMGTAYAVWTGIGAAGTFVLGLWLYHEPANTMRVASAVLIVLGVIGLKLADNA
jgi:quaternary ammonium compound-resistance protein SugE